eukprot:554985_1
MMRVLQTLYENNNIETIYKNNNDTTNLFIEVYSNFYLIEMDPICTNIQDIIEKRPDTLYVKCDYSAKFPFSKTIHDWCNSQKTKLKVNTMTQMQTANMIVPGLVNDTAKHLKREINNSMPPILNNL